MTTRRLARLLAAALLPILPLAACGDDDGADVRNVGEEDGGSPSGSGSGTGSGSGSGSASGTE